MIFFLVFLELFYIIDIFIIKKKVDIQLKCGMSQWERQKKGFLFPNKNGCSLSNLDGL